MEGSSSLSTLITSITGALGDFTTTTLGTILVAGLGVSVSLIIGWFAYHFITRAVQKALKKGKMQ